MFRIYEQLFLQTMSKKVLFKNILELLKRTTRTIMNDICNECRHKIECALKNITPTFEELKKNPVPRHKVQLNRWAWDYFTDCLILKDLYKKGGEYDY